MNFWVYTQTLYSWLGLYCNRLCDLSGKMLASTTWASIHHTTIAPSERKWRFKARLSFTETAGRALVAPLGRQSLPRRRSVPRSQPVEFCVPTWASSPFLSASGKGLKRNTHSRKPSFGSEVPKHSVIQPNANRGPGNGTSSQWVKFLTNSHLLSTTYEPLYYLFLAYYMHGYWLTVGLY